MSDFFIKIKSKKLTNIVYLIFFVLSIVLLFLILFYALGFKNYISRINESTSMQKSNFSALDEVFMFTKPGEEGPIGPSGPQGEKGNQGEKGPSGKSGKQGLVGPVGPTGEKGATGSQGPAGPQGNTGPQGATGPQGIAGATGATGATGPKGEKGEQGEKGEKGDKGDSGSDGVTTLGLHGSFYDTTTQTHSATNTAKAMQLNTTSTNETNGVSITNNNETPPRPTRITVAKAGTYNLQFSAQLVRATGNSGTVEAEIWLRKMESNVVFTNTRVTLTGNLDSAKYVAAWNFLVSLSANEYVELIWAVDDTRMQMPTITSGLTGPSIPSLIVTMTQVG